jgi:hypothetical protein
VGFEDIQVAVAGEVADTQSHTRLLLSVFVQGDPAFQAFFGKRAAKLLRQGASQGGSTISRCHVNAPGRLSWANLLHQSQGSVGVAHGAAADVALEKEYDKYILYNPYVELGLVHSGMGSVTYFIRLRSFRRNSKLIQNHDRGPYVLVGYIPEHV